jgi:putative acetyltransferase
VELRAYTGADAEATLNVFFRAVHETALAHYSPEQVAVWAAEHVSIGAWAKSRGAAHTRLAIIDGHVAGFTDLAEDGHIDMLFVDPDFGRQGVATTLLAATMALARQRGTMALTTEASLTAKPLFERHGFVVTEERHSVHRGVEFTTFAMRRVLDDLPVP